MKCIILLLACATAILGNQASAAQQEEQSLQNLLVPEAKNDLNEEVKKGVRFELYTRKNPEEPELMKINEEVESVSPHFKATRSTKILIHGWTSRKIHLQDLREDLLGDLNLNVIVVNWSGVDSVNYLASVNKIPAIARRVAELIDVLAGTYGVPPEKLHVIGHSLGAHIAGLSSKYITTGRIGRISGLDPAGPLIRNNPNDRLDKTHAVFVDVIHTCGNVLGRRETMGHVDFYPNGGKCSQPGCSMGDLLAGACSHNRVYDLFRETIKMPDSMVAVPSKPFDSWPCKEVNEIGDRVVMGLYTPESARGVYCLSTRSSSPFGYGAGMDVRSISSSGREPSRREASIMLSKFMKSKH